MAWNNNKKNIFLGLSKYVMNQIWWKIDGICTISDEKTTQIQKFDQ